MTIYDNGMEDWVTRISRIPSVWRTGELSVRQLFEPARSALADPAVFHAQVSSQLRKDPKLIEDWRVYSEDRRGGPSPYFVHHDKQTYEVGFFDGDRHEVQTYTDGVEACTDFIYRETLWVLTRARTR
jgi:hypothetical protein